MSILDQIVYNTAYVLVYGTYLYGMHFEYELKYF